jgi:hypothetical protein
MQQWRICAATIIKALARELDPLALTGIQLREGKPQKKKPVPLG